ncbi:MAG: diguanylate cyclase, partial [Lachnospiraceae bacterium]|nr:diguanylate cyclase [Lachnospiraceae bacterium]
SFARAFEQIWNCKPSEFRKAKFTELFPRFTTPAEEREDIMLYYKHVDISELYDLFQKRRECCFVLSDISYMISINKISHKAGDLAILEQMRRMTDASGNDDIVFRIGGDEFCILTSRSDMAYAEEIADKIRRMNGQPFFFEDQSIPLTLHVATVSLKECRQSEEVYAGLHNALEQCKQ